MNRNFVAGLFGGLIGSAMLLIVLSVAGIVGAGGADISHGNARPDVVGAATPLTSTFTYRGQLKNNGNPVNGSCSMAFRLYDDPSASINLIGSPITTTVPVTNGLFAVGLNFGNAFNGEGRWLDINVDCGSGSMQLTPRQALTAVPYAIYGLSTGALQGYPVTTTAPISGQVLKWNNSAWTPSVDAGGSGALRIIDSLGNDVGLYNMPGDVFAANATVVRYIPSLDKWFIFTVTKNGFQSSESMFYYESTDCTGQPYGGSDYYPDSFFIQGHATTNEYVYYAAGPQIVITPQSIGNELVCYGPPPPGNLSSSPVATFPNSDLGFFTPPFRLTR
jgi:hypothetical protein